MTTVEQAAQRFKSWASDKGILSYELPDEDRVQHGTLDDMTNVPEAHTAIQVFQNRKINLVGVNAEAEQIVVFTHKNITQKELDILPNKSEDGYSIIYIKAHPPRIRFPTSSVGGGNAFALHNGKFTCGSSVSHANEVAAGTMGCLVRDVNGVMYGLTNNHVTGRCGYSDPDFPIVAPGLLDVKSGGHDPFTIGHHARVSPWISGTPENSDVSGNLDMALFKIKDESMVSSMQHSLYDTPTSVLEQKENIVVEKVGRTTGRTRGKVVAKSVGYEPVMIQVTGFKGLIYFTDLLIVQGINGPFSAPGDSGSLVCFRPAAGSPKALGLLFAGSADQTLSFVLPIKKVLDYFGVSIVSGHNT